MKLILSTISVCSPEPNRHKRFLDSTSLAKQHFVRSGLVNVNLGSVNRIGQNGTYRSRSAQAYTNSTSAAAYATAITDTKVDHDWYQRYYGYPLRCLAD